MYLPPYKPKTAERGADKPYCYEVASGKTQIIKFPACQPL